MKSIRIHALAMLVIIASILLPGAGHAQQDGPRGYMLSPEGVHGLVFANVFVEANQAPDHGTVVVDSDITSYLAVPLYSQPFTVADNVASLFVVQPRDASLKKDTESFFREWLDASQWRTP